MSFPNSYRELPGNERVRHPQFFDPALKQYASAFRHGEPRFASLEDQSRWHRLRRRAWHALLREIAYSPWAEHLVLRGSVLLWAWFDINAREFGDLDWVVRPQTLGIDDSKSKEMMRDLVGCSWRIGASLDKEIRVKQVLIDDIWTYDRVPGRRIMTYWEVDRLGPGCLQMDFVFGEELPDEPIRSVICLSDEPEVELWTVGPELSLAWKLMWLDTDTYPQGKDLYDATLLAEATVLPPNLLSFAFADRLRRKRPPTADTPFEWGVDWDAFRQEYPWIPGTLLDYQERLAKALGPSFAALRRESSR